MPHVHLGAVDLARHDSVHVHSVSLKYRVGTQPTGSKWNNTHFLCNHPHANLSFCQTMSVPTNEVRKTLERNPGLRSPLDIPPPLDTALYIYTFIHLNIYTIIHLYECINAYIDTFHSYICTFIELGATGIDIYVACAVSWGVGPRGLQSAVRPQAPWCI